MADAGIDWGLVKAPLTNQAPQSGLGALVTGLGAGGQAASSVFQGMQQGQITSNMPKLTQQAIQQTDVANAMKSYELAQQILAPSVMALQSGDTASAKSIYERGVKGLESAGIDVSKFGAPKEFDPKFVSTAFNNVSQQMQMAKQMMDMASSQSMIDYHTSQQQKNAADIAKTSWETGLPLGGAFTGPGGTMMGGQPGQMAGQPGQMPGQAVNMSGLSPKAQQEVRTAQANKSIEARSALADQANAARGTLNLADEALNILNENPKSTGKAGIIGQYTNTNVERLKSIYDQFTVNKLKSDYAGGGLGSLDVAVFNVLKNTTPSVTDYEANQRLNIQNMQAASKGVILTNDIAQKLNAAGIYDENTRAAIGNDIAAKLNIKKGGTINLQNFNNADQAVNDVFKKYNIPVASQDGQETPSAAVQITPAQKKQMDELVTQGYNPADIQAYYAELNKKQLKPRQG